MRSPTPRKQSNQKRSHRKVEPRKDKPYEPVISRSECWARLRLVGHILDGIVEHGDAPEQVVARAFEFSCYIETLRQKHHAWPNAKDSEALYSAIESAPLVAHPSL
jgi:hypothetical protein